MERFLNLRTAIAGLFIVTVIVGAVVIFSDNDDSLSGTAGDQVGQQDAGGGGGNNGGGNGGGGNGGGGNGGGNNGGGNNGGGNNGGGNNGGGNGGGNNGGGNGGQPTAVPPTSVPAGGGNNGGGNGGGNNGGGGNNERVSYCHIAGLASDPANVILLEDMPLSSLNGHFEESGTPLAGHEQDFLIPPVPASLQGVGYPVGSAADCVATVGDDDDDDDDDDGGNERVSYCHIAGLASDPANVILLDNMPIPSLNGHFDENGTPLAGHEQDFLIPPVPASLEGLGYPVGSAADCVATGDDDDDDDDDGGNERVTYCHVAGLASDPANWIILDNMPIPSLNGHFDNNGTPKAGHEQDFLIPPVPASLEGLGYPVGSAADCGTGEGDDDDDDDDDDGERVSYCHIAGLASDPANWIILDNMPIPSLNGHFDNNGTPKAGHEDDFLIAPIPDSLADAGYPVGSAEDCAPPSGDDDDDDDTGDDDDDDDDPVCGQIGVDVYGFPVYDPNAVCGSDDNPPFEPIEVAQASCPDWLLYHTDQTEDWEIFRIDGPNSEFAGSDPNVSQGVGTNVFDVAPSRSPGGDWVVFTSTRDGNFEIYITRPDGTEQQRITVDTIDNAPLDTDPVWSPNGQYIAYESQRGATWDLYLVDVLAGTEIRLTQSGSHDVNPAWSPDSSQVVFQSFRDGFWQIYSIDIETFEETLISDGSGDDHDPQFNAEGDKLIFRSYRDGDTSVIYMADADGSNVMQISDPAGDATNHAFSDDNALIAYQSNVDGDEDIYVYEVETQEIRQVTDNDIPDYAPTWYCGSHEVVWTSDIVNPDDPNIFSVNVDGITIAISVLDEATQLTFEDSADQYPQNTPSEENASRQGRVPVGAKNR